MSTQSIPHIVVEIHLATLDKKGEDPVLLNLQGLTTFADYFYITSGWSDRQLKAIQREIEERLRKKRILPLHVEGEDSGSWILLDYGEVIVHIFLHQTRKYYDLEHLWADAQRIDLSTQIDQSPPLTAHKSKKRLHRVAE